MTRDAERWGTLFERFKDEAPRKMLAIDGGGIRGLISLGMLGKMEKLLAQNRNRGPDFRLCEYIDYVAGTSTGAIIAAGLARGMAVEELSVFTARTGRICLRNRDC